MQLCKVTNCINFIGKSQCWRYKCNCYTVTLVPKSKSKLKCYKQSMVRYLRTKPQLYTKSASIISFVKSHTTNTCLSLFFDTIYAALYHIVQQYYIWPSLKAGPDWTKGQFFEKAIKQESNIIHCSPCSNSTKIARVGRHCEWWAFRESNRLLNNPNID